MEIKYYDQFRFGYAGRSAKQGHVWLAPGVPIANYQEEKSGAGVRVHMQYPPSGDEELTRERYLCEGMKRSGFDKYTLNTSGNLDKEALGVAPALCYEFADLCATEDEFKAFADKWGLLYVGAKLAPAEWERGPIAVGLQRETTEADIWPSAISKGDLMKAHRELRFASVLWRLLEADNHSRIQEVFRFDKTQYGEEGLMCRFSDSIELKQGSEDEVYDGKWVDTSEREGIDGPSYDVKWGEAWEDKLIISSFSEAYHYVESGDIAAAAIWVLSQLVNRNLPERVMTNSILRKDIHGLILATRPTSLLGALWLQLFLSICGERTLRRCEICGEWDAKKNLRKGRYHKNCYSKKWMREHRAGGESSKKAE